MSASPERPLVDKGKGRARSPDLSERTPLLASQSHSSRNDADIEITSRSRRTLWSKLTSIFLITLVICIIGFIVVAVLAYTYAARASLLSPDDLLERAVIIKGPDRLDVLNVTESGGIWVNLEGRVGVDAGAVIGVSSDEDDGIFRDMWKALGRWGVRRLDRITIKLNTIDISPKDDPSTILASFDTSAMDVPLTTNPPSDLSWLTNVSTPVFISPTQDPSILVKFVRDSWRDGAVAVQAHVKQAVIHGGSLHDHSWRRRFEQKRSGIHISIQMRIPPLPGLPDPGPNSPFPSVSDLITLETFGVKSDPDTMFLYGRASIIDPAPLTFNFTSPILPFTISLPSTLKGSTAPVSIASIRTQPFSLTHPNITIHITGTVLPIASESTPVLSAFITNYLSGESSPIIISSPFFPAHIIETIFPAPNPKPRILRNVTIHNMKVVPRGTTFTASGTVYARVVLPRGMKVSLDVNRVLPDVLVFDGEVPLYSTDEKDKQDGDPAPPLPDPLPEHAFARIRPDEWLPSSSKADEASGDDGSIYTVTAEILDVPLQVLPGREKDFSNFVSKVVFGTKGAVAGILGSAAVAIDVEGLPNGNGQAGEMELTGLPFQGSVLVGKKDL